MAIVVAILGAGVVLTALTTEITKMSEPGIRLVSSVVSTNGVTVTNEVPFLPAGAEGWEGGELEGLSKQERDVLPKDTEGVRRVYKDKEGNEIHCSVILAGKDVSSIHRPEVCLPGQGWKIMSKEVEDIPTPAAPGGRLQVMRMNTSLTLPQETGKTTVSYFVFIYWFVGKDRLTPHHWQRIFWTSKDRVFHNRNHRWAYFLMSVRVKQPRSDQELKQEGDAAMKILSGFVQQLYPKLVQD
jgi:EpsI family protein